MINEMTSRERILAAINHQPVDRIPTDYWAVDEITNKLMKHLGVKSEIELFDALGIDGIPVVHPTYTGPELVRTAEKSEDIWGVRYKHITYADGAGVYGEVSHNPIAEFETIEEIEANYKWPSADSFDYSNIPALCAQHPNRAIMAGYASPFYMYTNIRGLEQSLIDLATEEELADYILGNICDFLYDYHKRIFEAAQGQIHVCQYTDDFGTQNGLMISVDMFNRFFRKQFERFVKMYREYGIKVFHHDDGAIRPLIPELVDVGVDVLNPIQWHLPGMDLKELKDNFGKQICFHGAIDNQHVLPFGTVDEVKKEVATCIDILASDGTGYILAPCHNIQIVSPIENILTMYKTAHELGRFV